MPVWLKTNTYNNSLLILIGESQYRRTTNPPPEMTVATYKATLNIWDNANSKQALNLIAQAELGSNDYHFDTLMKHSK